jgi:hypothetical protein
MPAVAVGEGLNCDKPMVKAHGDLVDRINPLFDP